MKFGVLALLFSIAAVCEVVGLAVALRISFLAKASLVEFQRLNPEGHSTGSYDQMSRVSVLVSRILSHLTLAWWVVALLCLGIAVGLVANILALGWV